MTFQSSPNLSPGCWFVVFQSSPNLLAGRGIIMALLGRAHVGFNPHPASRLGALALSCFNPDRTFCACLLCFNPRLTFWLGAALPVYMSSSSILLQFQSSRSQEVGCNVLIHPLFAC